MQDQSSNLALGDIVATLAQHSARPRYAFLVLQLVADAADHRGRAGPFILRGNVTSTVRDWLVTQLMPMSGRGTRRTTMRERISLGLAGHLTGDEESDAQLIARELDDQARAIGRQNVSRAISDLVRAGLLTRHYAGYATDHVNRGAGRHAVYVLQRHTMVALGKAFAGPPAGTMPVPPRQSDLFAGAGAVG